MSMNVVTWYKVYSFMLACISYTCKTCVSFLLLAVHNYTWVKIAIDTYLYFEILNMPTLRACSCSMSVFSGVCARAWILQHASQSPQIIYPHTPLSQWIFFFAQMVKNSWCMAELSCLYTINGLGKCALFNKWTERIMYRCSESIEKFNWFRCERKANALHK